MEKNWGQKNWEKLGSDPDITNRGEKVVGSNTLGFKNLLLSGGPLYTNKGNVGLGIAIGLALPFYPVPVNATVNLPLDKLNNKKPTKK